MAEKIYGSKARNPELLDKLQEHLADCQCHDPQYCQELWRKLAKQHKSKQAPANKKSSKFDEFGKPGKVIEEEQNYNVQNKAKSTLPPHTKGHDDGDVEPKLRHPSDRAPTTSGEKYPPGIADKPSPPYGSRVDPMISKEKEELNRKWQEEQRMRQATPMSSLNKTHMRDRSDQTEPPRPDDHVTNSRHRKEDNSHPKAADQKVKYSRHSVLKVGKYIELDSETSLIDALLNGFRKQNQTKRRFDGSHGVPPPRVAAEKETLNDVATGKETGKLEQGGRPPLITDSVMAGKGGKGNSGISAKKDELKKKRKTKELEAYLSRDHEKPPSDR